MYLYDKNGTVLSEIETVVARDGFPLSLALSEDGTKLITSYMKVEGDEPVSSVTFYNFGEVGKNETDNYVSGYDYLNTIIPYVQFMDNDSAFGVSDDRIVFFSGGERPVNVSSALLDEEVQSIYYSDKYVGLVFRNQTGESAYRLDVYNDNGNKIHSELFDLEYTDIVFNKDQIIIYSDQECSICNMKGVDKFTGSFGGDTALIIPTASVDKYVTVTMDSIDNVELK